MTNIVARLFLAISTLGQTRTERDERGATMVEYAILVSLISVVAILLIVTVGKDVLKAFTDVAAQMPGN